MVATEPMAVLAEPEGSEERLEELELLPEPMDSAVAAAQADRLEPQEMVGLELQAMSHLRMAALVATGAIPAVWLDRAVLEERRAGPEPLRAQLARMGPSLPAVGMAAMAEQVSARQRSARLEAMAEPEVLADLLATVASEEPAATEPRGRMALRDRCPGYREQTAKPEVRVAWVAPEVPVDRFQVMAAPEVMQGWVAPEVPVEMGPLVPMV